MFPTGKDSATFGDKGTSSKSGKGTGRAKTGRGTVRDFDSWTKQDRAETDVPKQEMDVLK